MLKNMGEALNGIERIFREQSGVISREQAIGAGFNRRQIEVALAEGRWRPVLRGVYRSNHHVLSQETWVRAVMLWAGPGSFLGGVAAAWWWGLCTEPSTRVQILLPQERKILVPREFRDRMLVRRSYLDRADQAVFRGLPVTGLARSALMGAVELGSQGSMMLDRALQRRVSLAELQACAKRLAGCTGAVQARKLLSAAGDGAAAESERLMAKLLRQAGITGWKINRGVRARGQYRVPDFLFDEAKLVVEVDGWAHHHDAERFQDDRSRQNALILAGWLVLRFTWHQLVHESETVIEQIRYALARLEVA